LSVVEVKKTLGYFLRVFYGRAQRLAAREWAEAHALLARHLAPRWWLRGQIGRLRAHLARLEEHAREAEAAVGAAAWAAGARLYMTYFHLEVRLVVHLLVAEGRPVSWGL
jgi:hypothetical protein